MLVQKTWDGDRKGRWVKAWRKNFERQHINSALGTEIGEGSYRKQSQGSKG
jgi:hypothetical protein